MRHVEQRDDGFGDYIEIVEDEALADALNMGAFVKFKVIEDEWTSDYKTRIIRNVDLIAVSFDTP